MSWSRGGASVHPDQLGSQCLPGADHGVSVLVRVALRVAEGGELHDALVLLPRLQPLHVVEHLRRAGAGRAQSGGPSWQAKKGFPRRGQVLLMFEIKRSEGVNMRTTVAATKATRKILGGGK